MGLICSYDCVTSSNDLVTYDSLTFDIKELVAAFVSGDRNVIRSVQNVRYAVLLSRMGKTV